MQYGFYSDPGGCPGLRGRALHYGVPAHAVAATARYFIRVLMSLNAVSKIVIAGFWVVQSEQKSTPQ